GGASGPARFTSEDRRTARMLLAIDAGNTNLVFGVFEGDRLRCQWRAVTNSPRTADEHAVWLSQLMSLQGLSFADIDAAIIATVVPRALFDLRTLCRKYLEREPVVIGEDAVLGIENRIDRPSEAGADRLVNAVGGYVQHGGP